MPPLWVRGHCVPLRGRFSSLGYYFFSAARPFGTLRSLALEVLGRAGAVGGGRLAAKVGGRGHCVPLRGRFSSLGYYFFSAARPFGTLRSLALEVLGRAGAVGGGRLAAKGGGRGSSCPPLGEGGTAYPSAGRFLRSATTLFSAARPSGTLRSLALEVLGQACAVGAVGFAGGSAVVLRSLASEVLGRAGAVGGAASLSYSGGSGVAPPACWGRLDVGWGTGLGGG